MAIALIPSITMLVGSVGIAAYLVNGGLQAKDWAELSNQATLPTISLVESMQQERQTTLSAMSGDDRAAAELIVVRGRVDSELRSMAPIGETLTKLGADTFDESQNAAMSLLGGLPAMRKQADSRSSGALEVYAFYNQAVGVVTAGARVSAGIAPESATSAALVTAIELFRAQEAISRSAAIALPAIDGKDLSADQLIEFSRQVGVYRTTVSDLPPALDSARKAQLASLIDTAAWRQVSSTADAIIRHGVSRPGEKPAELSISPTEWKGATAQVSSALLDLWRAQNTAAQEITTKAAARAVTNSLIGGGVALILAATAFAAAFVLANRFIARLVRLQHDTLAVADHQLPDIMLRLREGQAVDVNAEILSSVQRNDEIGHVAAAFDRAYHSAVTAAMAEAKTRAGFNSVFLNIAHRSQVVAHRQLEVLDQAERELEDPVQLQTLFQLDHLATRARRHAENLIILGGVLPGRQWRRPVELMTLARGAVAETLEYARIRVLRLPDVSIVGTAVADIIHLLAELMDNATAFSPPEAPVEIAASVVGRGIAVEIRDQGIGMTESEFSEWNAMLGTAPDFSLETLTSDSRMGLFVVAKLAARHAISVRLSESEYGGVRAIVLIQTDLVDPASPDSAEFMSSGQRPALPSHLQSGTPTTPHEAVPAADLRGTWFPDSPAPDDRPALPRRDRQEGLAPPHANEPVPHPAESPTRHRSAGQPRNPYPAIDEGAHPTGSTA